MRSASERRSRGRRAVHLITNSRALPPDRVEPLVSDAARVAREAAADARVVLRGDSTLRGHLLEEYLGVRSVVASGRWPVLLLVPALPAAGRITVDGVHLFVRDGVPTPLHETEYANDGVFSYSSARLLDWAEERSDGLFRASDGAELSLAALRAGGPGGRVGRAVLARRARPSGRLRAGRGDRGRPGDDRSRAGRGPGEGLRGDRPLRARVRRRPRRHHGARAGIASGWRARARRLRLVRAADDAAAGTVARRLP